MSLNVGDMVQVYGQGPVGVVISSLHAKEWYDRAAAQWKTFNYHQVLICGDVIKVDPFAMVWYGEK